MHNVLMANYNTTVHEGVPTSGTISMHNIQDDSSKFPIGQVLTVQSNNLTIVLVWKYINSYCP